jgi:hypothetical protein
MERIVTSSEVCLWYKHDQVHCLGKELIEPCIGDHIDL